ncbi:MAG TPA: hypothetical protein VIJ47_01340 [Acidimicrobiales bacterium]
MNGGNRRLKDGAALVGWIVVAMWGWAAASGADSLRTDPHALRGDEKATLLTVSGTVLVIVAVALAIAALIRLIGDRGPLGPPVLSLVLGWTLIGLFAVFFLWGLPLTKNQGLAAVAAFELPYFIAGLAVLWTRPRAGEDATTQRATPT